MWLILELEEVRVMGLVVRGRLLVVVERYADSILGYMTEIGMWPQILLNS